MNPAGTVITLLTAMDQKTDMDSSEAQRFVLKAADHRSVDFDGMPVRDLPEWGGVARGEGVRFILHPPLDFEIAYRIPEYLVFTPYARAVVDVAVEDSSPRRKAWGAGSAFFVPPETCVRARMAEPVEFLCIVIAAERAEEVIARAVQGRTWAPEVIENFNDAGFAALQREVRRSLLGDPLVEPAYLGSLADAMMTRIACRLSGRSIEPQKKEVLPPFVLRSVTRQIEETLAETIRVEEIAKQVGLSRSHFSRAFQAATGQTAQEFIITRRICRARDLLIETEQNVAEIAVATGFSSQAHLSSAFKKRLGVTPARYRDSFQRETQSMS